jgi:alpha-glucosidase (family GH31 glycosyl hydrolase)
VTGLTFSRILFDIADKEKSGETEQDQGSAYMSKEYDRRQVLKVVGTTCAAFILPGTGFAGDSGFGPAEQELEIRIASVSAHTLRLSIFSARGGGAVRSDGSLVQEVWDGPVTTLSGKFTQRSVRAGEWSVKIMPDPLTFGISGADGVAIQQLKVDRASGVVSFATGDSPLLGLGEGGPQFDRRGSVDTMKRGQGGYKLQTNGGRVPIPWLIGTAGWAMFFHAPFGTFDFSGAECKFLPAGPDAAYPLDIFFVASREPATIMSEYARLTGNAELPPLWSFGYMQSHRTLGSPKEILAEAKTFREKKLPCDAMIYLSTGFCPNGWNTENGAFEWNVRAFPDPPAMLAELHKDNFRAVIHTVILTDRLTGRAQDACDVTKYDETEAGCYWEAHRKDFAMGVDGWWPDEGDPLDIASSLVRNRMYWEGPQIDRPNERPFALHRNGYAGMQRYASFLWSGDVYSTWETLKTHLPIAANTGLSGVPYWGTDIGGFVPTKEFTAELFVRWFQFGAFCTLFRSHGRAWKLRLPWGWNTGDPGPTEIRNYGGAAIPDESQLHNPQVEIICRKYLELRYRMLPYIYSAVRECTLTGMPVMRSLWLHYPQDPVAVARGDEYLWGRDILVAPVVEQGATARAVYLPRGDWWDFWTGELVKGGREITRAVDLETTPLYVRAGAILPLGPVKQFTDEKVDGPLEISVYAGGDASFLFYEDDGNSFNYRQGEWMGIQMRWNDARRILKLQLAAGSRMLAPGRRDIEVKLGETMRKVVFEGRAVEVAF